MPNGLAKQTALRLRQQLAVGSWLERLVLFAPVVIWFSYLPNFHVARTSGMNLEFSLVIIYLGLIALVSVPRLYAQRHWLWQQPAVWLTLAFVLWNVSSILWSVNPLRSVLTAGLWGVVWMNFLALLSVCRPRQVVPLLLDMSVLAAVGMSVLAFWQVAYGAWSDWGLCRGCVAAGFGFVRPSGLAIEPQFFGSLLLAPLLLYTQRWLKGQTGQWGSFVLGLLMSALYLTLSRGAMMAAAAGLVVLVMSQRHSMTRRLVGRLLTVVVLSGLVGMVWHAVFTQLNPRLNDTWYDAVSRSVNQLTLGRVQLPRPNRAESTLSAANGSIALSPIVPKAPQAPQSPAVAPQAPPPTQATAQFDGYVARSTTERTGLSRHALETWSRGGWRAWLGVGVGGAGQAMAAAGRVGPFEIVQHEFISTLLELGVIGLAIGLAVVAGWYWQCRRWPWMVAIGVAYIVQWNFFAGLPNALHIYLSLAILSAYVQHQASWLGRSAQSTVGEKLQF